MVMFLFLSIVVDAVVVLARLKYGGVADLVVLGFPRFRDGLLLVD